MKWTDESLFEESKKYGSRNESKRMNISIFNFLYKRNFISEIAKENNRK